MLGTAHRARPARLALTIPRLRIGVETTALVVALSLGFVIRLSGVLARSFGLLFSILAIHQVYLLYTRGGAPRVALTALLAGLAVLSHLEAAVFVATSAAVMFLAYGRNRAAVRNSLLVAAGTLLL